MICTLCGRTHDGFEPSPGVVSTTCEACALGYAQDAEPAKPARPARVAPAAAAAATRRAKPAAAKRPS